MNHTQGKWEVEEYKGLFTVVTDGEPICVFYLLQEEDHHYQEFENAEANARLITAAPDLLDALKRIKRIENGCKSRGVGYDMQVDILATDAITEAKQK